MIDTKELRIRVEEYGKGGIDLEEIHELLDRLEAAESALSNLGVTPDEARDGLARHKALMARLEAAEKAVTEAYQRGYETGQEEIEKERDALRANIEAMGKQEPTRDWWDCLIADISAIDCMYRGGPTYAHDAYWMRDRVVWMLKKRRDALPGAQPAPSIPEAVMEVIAGLVYEVERNICPHEETHRGGQWEICDMCGARWADDMGGKPEFKWPEVVEKARDMLEAAPGAQPAPSFADAYQGAREEVAIWKKRALEAEALNRKFVAEINGPTYMGEPAQPAQRMNMQTADQITQAFKAELQALLDKYGAELSARDMWEGYPECGENVRMLVDVPAIYDADHNCLREYTEIDLGPWVLSTQAMPKEAKP